MKGECSMEANPPIESLDSSFDLVARQDAAEEAIDALRGDVDDIKTRLDRVARAAARPVIEGAASEASVASSTAISAAAGKPSSSRSPAPFRVTAATPSHAKSTR